LGANAMMGYDVYFDIARGRIGLAESNCDYMSLVLSEGALSNPPNTASAKIEVVEEEKEVENNGNDRDDANDKPAAETDPEKPGLDQSENEEEIAVESTFLDSKGSDEDGSGNESTVKTEIQDPNENHGKQPYELIINDQPITPTHGVSSDAKAGFVEELLQDMKHECSSIGCRSVAGLFVLGTISIVIAFIRKAISRRRAVREYQEAELEISDLALDSYSDDGRGYTDDPPMPEIS